MEVADCISNSVVNMEYYQTRLKTFDVYPKQMLPDKFQLARAGLFYTGKSDICQCFQCKVKLSVWERDEDAIKEHYKWSPDCESGLTFGSSAFVKPLDPKCFQHWKNDRNDGM